jgi:hypothetical protein
MPSRLFWCFSLTGAAALAAPAQTPPVVQVSGTQAQVRAVAYIYDSIPITRDELADFLIARGGYEKIELLINRKIIETECAKKKITCTPQEMEAVLSEDLQGLGFSRETFLENMLPRYNKTYYEWMEDVIKPRILLKKLCQDQVTATEEDARKLFENQFGEKRRCQMVMWPHKELKAAQQGFEQARKSQIEFDSVARAQANPSLAAAAGHILPISRHQTDKDPQIERVAFQLKIGETSQLIECGGQQCWVMLKLHEILPPDSKAKFEDHKEKLMKQALDKKVEEFIPIYMAKLKEQARPTKPLIGAPTEWQFKSESKIKK